MTHDGRARHAVGPLPHRARAGVAGAWRWTIWPRTCATAASRGEGAAPRDRRNIRLGALRREIRCCERLRHPAMVPVLDAQSRRRCAATSCRSAGRVAPQAAGGADPVPVSGAPNNRHGGGSAGLRRRRGAHRDIKPANILLDGERVLVCDFGVARAVEAAAGDSISSSGLVLGTPGIHEAGAGNGQPDRRAQ